MISMRVVQASINQIVCVPAVEDGFVATAWAMHMIFGVACQAAFVGAVIRMLAVNFDQMFLYLVPFRMFQMTARKIISMALVFDCRVSAAWTVVMSVGFFHNMLNNFTSTTESAARFAAWESWHATP